MFQVTIDCAHPARQARFWADALGYRLEGPPDGFDTWTAYWRSVGIPEDELGGPDPDDPDGDVDSVVDPDGVGPRIWFQLVPESKTVKNRIHLDVPVGGGRGVPLPVRRDRIEAAADRLVRAGATRLRVLDPPGGGHYAVTLHDPEGNEFCLM